jgi:hypothetical protein
VGAAATTKISHPSAWVCVQKRRCPGFIISKVPAADNGLNIGGGGGSKVNEKGPFHYCRACADELQYVRVLLL